ncbi:MAG: DUF2290 domain-containing protein [Proteobacteria bacterium]|nr:DUF2290 domain-containing protein [Pseudomonadota bacterium]
MTPAQTLRQIYDLTEGLVLLSLSNEQNFPSTSGNMTENFEITVSTAAAMTVALKNVSYGDIYTELQANRCFNIKMLDGALLTLRYRFRAGAVCEHSLTYFPCPDLAHFQNEPEIYLEDEVYADIISRNIVTFPVRFDFSDDVGKFVEIDHPLSHMTLGQYKNCRIPVCSPLTPLAFGSFILRNFYNTAFRKYTDQLPTSALSFHKTIAANERKIPHLVCCE